MAYSKTILCLANSRKTSGRCIAGREVTSNGYGGWIRPVSSRSTREISEEDRRYSDGNRATVRDIVRITMKGHVPSGCHVEDHQIDDEYYWDKLGEASWTDINQLVEPVTGPIWINGESTYHGVLDKIPVTQANGLASSLMLIKPQQLRINVSFESGLYGGGKRRVRADFLAGQHRYLLQVTDPSFETDYLQKTDGSYPIQNAVLCISLSEPFHDYVFKLVAAVITP